MLITRKSTLSGIESTLNLPVTEEQMKQFYSGEGLIQNIFPSLTPYQRDWLKFGFTEQEYNELYPPEENASPMKDEQPSSFNDADITLQEIIKDFKLKLYDDKFLQGGVDTGPLIKVIMDNMNLLSNELKKRHEIMQYLKDDDDSF